MLNLQRRNINFMRRIHLIIILATALVFVKCTSRMSVNYPTQLELADSLSLVNPDRAIALLKTCSEEMSKADEPVRHYYELLTIKANDKAHRPMLKDSLIIATLTYYENGGDIRMLPEAYYYNGRMLSMIGDAPQALDRYNKALDVIFSDEYAHIRNQKEKATNKLLGCIYAQKGYILREQNYYNEALENFKAGFKIDSANHDTTGMIFGY